MSGAPVVRGTRVPVQAVIDNADDGYTAGQIAAEIYHGRPVEPTRRVIEFAEKGSRCGACFLTNPPLGDCARF